MASASRDPYKTLGVSRSVSDAELRAAYRRLVQLHHPDHNGGSADSEARFEEVQEAYAEIQRLRAAGASSSSRPRASQRPRTSAAGSRRAADPDVEARLAEMERELREARAARERAAEAARQAARDAREAVRDRPGRPSDEELGYYSSDDSFGSILADARKQVSDLLSDAREQPVTHRVADLLDELADRLRKRPD